MNYRTLMLLFLMGSITSQLKAQDQFVGQILFVPYNFAPRGTMDCDGTLLPISQNTPLFALIGTTYGGDGRTTFALPNARGRVIIDDGQGAGLSNYNLGQTGGSDSHNLTVNEMPQHTHQMKATSQIASQNKPSDGIPAGTKALDKEYSSSTSGSDTVNMNFVMISPTGGNASHENRMPSLTLKCVIVVNGIFPSRS